MGVEKRLYKVGDLSFAVILEQPWEFMEFPYSVQKRIEEAQRGGNIKIDPIRAGDKVPARTLVKSVEEYPHDRTLHTLDFSQYEPFRCYSGEQPIFSLTFHADNPSRYLAEKETWQQLTIVENSPARFIAYKTDNYTVYEFESETGDVVNYLFVSSDSGSGDFFSNVNQSSHRTLTNLNTALMVMYTYNSARHGALLMHSSVVLHKGLANMFLGTSGTGKSTHSRLWLDNIEKVELLNDDNPILRLKDGAIMVYGSPWSGKTPCYRNAQAKVRGIVALKQAPANNISRLYNLNAYSELISSASSILWDDEIAGAISDTASTIAMTLPCFKMECLPDADAANLCCTTLSAN